MTSASIRRSKLAALRLGSVSCRDRLRTKFSISCHVCHPSLANDNLSGISLAVALAKRLQGESRRYSYRFLFIPGHDRLDHLASA